MTAKFNSIKMKQVLIIAAGFFFSMNTFGQIRDIKVPQVINSSTKVESKPDTIIKVSYVNKDVSERNPAYYLNGQLVNENILKTINPKIIEDFRVEKQDILIENKKYYGQIFINTKSDYNLQLISLTDLKLKYTDLKNSSTIFMIDNEIISDNYDSFLVDENYILRISVEKIDNRKERVKFNLVKIWTRTEENIRKSKEIRIRGIEEI
jgi:hypothetical protein